MFYPYCVLWHGISVHFVSSCDLTPFSRLPDPKCIFRGNLTSKTIDSFPSTCSTVCSFLEINEFTDVSEERLTEVFKNMKLLLGQLKIVDTGYTSARFLSSLEIIEGGYGTAISNNNEMIELGFANLQYLKCNSFLIVLNSKLERLAMPKLIKMMWYVEKDITVWILYSSPDFCLDTIAAKVFTKVRDPFYTDIDASTFCEPKFDEKMCKTPSAGCVEIFGNVEIGPGFDMGVMRNVEVIYGNLVIKNTTIVDLNGFESLQYIISLDNIDPVLLVEGNSQLVNATFPKLERIKSSSESEAIVFNGNNKQLLSDATSCILLYFALYSPSEMGPTFDGQSCLEILDATENATTTISPIIVSTTEKAVDSSTGNATRNDNKTRETVNHFMMIFLLLVMYHE